MGTPQGPELGALGLKLYAEGDTDLRRTLDALDAKASAVNQHVAATAVSAATDVRRGIEATASATTVAHQSMRQQVAATANAEQVAARRAIDMRAAYRKVATALNGSDESAAALRKARHKEQQKEIEESIRILTLKARTVNVTSREEVNEIAASIAAEKQYVSAKRGSEIQVMRLAAAHDILEKRINAEAAATQRATVAQMRQSNMMRVFGINTTNAQGAVVGFGRAGLTALNAVSFGVAQLASTGEASFRSLAASGASLLAFLGPKGAIASIVLSVGLSITDYFTRARDEIKKSTTTALEQAERLRRGITLALRKGDGDSIESAIRDVYFGTENQSGILDLREDILQRRKELSDRVNNIDKVGLSQRKAYVERSAQLTDELNKQIENLAELERKDQSLKEKLFSIPVKKDREPITVTAAPAANVTKSIQEQIAALETFARLGQITNTELRTALDLYFEQRNELEKGNKTLTQRAEILERLNRLEAIVPKVTSPEIKRTPSTGPALRLVFPEDVFARSEATRINDTERRTRIQKSLDDLVTSITPSAKAASGQIAAAMSSTQTLNKEFEDWSNTLLMKAADVDSVFASAGHEMGRSLFEAIRAGAAEGGDAAAQVLLGAFGNIMQEMGMALLSYGVTMTKLLPAFSNPLTSETQHGRHGRRLRAKKQ